ncbi:hypothetical protein Sgou_45640 [Streptomyces gougerotii]|uniref:Uncharacterized protein n=2 Tax=Streptomyces diastaticus group TaxID=2849069 RepID=A0A8H9HL75_9ACTN|nr:hypothetical protein Srut_19310 [Streptomyces rutgersensis]GFH69583.1 hypothetical protein Sdia_03510 [Streptomyces diastaticus subsp. diastaticus]GFH79894.1 hypothetical protein Sgou_45640 [Streptomyces gougerotii]GGU20733.1 hypothetical protein GCM10015534_24310 [Streptomyces diastaticus subsp. diastaticus]GGU63377.1 hypothetical protein GCM10010227_16120 [Streptomyces gougerotii]
MPVAVEADAGAALVMGGVGGLFVLFALRSGAALTRKSPRSHCDPPVPDEN